MALVTWSDKLSVGIKSIDDQHSVLFNTINELHAAMLKGQARQIIGKLLGELLLYTRNHFSDEEKMMADKGYPGLDEHIKVHRALTKKVEEYSARYEKGDLSLSLDLSEFLSNWLTAHIQGVDRSYGPYMNERGVR